MTKPFLIVSVVEGELGVIRERDKWNDAVDCAVQLAADQCNAAPEEIRKELEEDSDFLSPNGDIHIYLAQADD